MNSAVRVEVGILKTRDPLGVNGLVDVNSGQGARNFQIFLSKGATFVPHGVGRLVGHFIDGGPAEMPGIGTKLVLHIDPDNPNKVLAWAEKPRESERSRPTELKLAKVQPVRRPYPAYSARR